MTRLERIQKMSAEEMAKFIRELIERHWSAYGCSCYGCPLQYVGICIAYNIEKFLLEEDDGTWI